MSFRRCIDGKVAAGRLSRQKADEILAEHDRLRQDYERHMAPEMAEAAAAVDTARILDETMRRKAKLASLSILATTRIKRDMEAHPQGLAQAVIEHLDRHGGSRATYSSVAARQREARGMIHALWAAGFERFRPKVAGLVSPTGDLRQLVRALYGEKVADPEIPALARAYGEAAEYARKRHNLASADGIAERQDWRLPNPKHDTRAVRAVDRDTWIDFVWDKLDRERMIDHDTGRPMADFRLRFVLGEVYDTIRTNGLIDLSPGAAGRSMLANRRNHQRVLAFKDADAWLAYNDRFGQSDIFGTLVAHLDGMSRDIGLLEVLGPNPDAMFRSMLDRVRQDAALRGARMPNTRMKTAQDTYDVLTGRINEGEMGAIASSVTAGRDLLTAAQLGGAFLSSLSDIGFAGLTARFNGLSTTRVLAGYLRMMNPANAGDRQLAVRLGLIADSAASMALAQHRYYGEVIGPHVTRKIADVTLRASLLTPWTQAGRHAFGMEFLSYAATQTGREFRDLDEAFRAALMRHGMTEADWDIIRHAPTLDHGGVPFLDAHGIARSAARPGDRRAVEAAARLMELVLTETEFAVPSATPLVRAMTTQGTRPNTFVGQLMRSIAMYKSFSVSIVTMHLMRGLGPGSLGQKAGYYSTMVIMATMLGALAYQAKQIQNGRDPLSMDPSTEEGRKFWAAAMWQGGGLGIFGDFMFSDVNRFGRGPSMAFAGPVADIADRLLGLTLGNIQELAQGEETNAGREAFQMMRDYMPGGTLWYARLALRRTIMDQLEEMIDGRGARQQWRNMERRAQRDYGQRFWWRPGEATPERGPAFTPR